MTDLDARYLAILDDLEVEGRELESVVRGLDTDGWRLDTQSKGWTIAHQIGHLTVTEELMLAALTDETQFREMAGTARTKPSISDDELNGPRVSLRLEAWTASRDALLGAFRSQPPDGRIPWMGPSMSMTSAATSRIMEIWAHGQDVYDALGKSRPATHRLRHIAHLAIAARDYSFINRGLAAPSEPFRVEIHGPDDQTWVWGPQDAAQTVEGDAYDFALLATRRIHRSDARVQASGRDAMTWLRTIQAYAGPPGPRRRPIGRRGASA